MNATVWRWFPLGLFGAMGFVFLVNGYMVYTAVVSFPGTAGTDGFDLSNDYKRVLDTAAQQSALGWKIEAGTDASRRPWLRLTDRNGATLAADRIDAQAERPVGPIDATILHFGPATNGRVQAGESLLPGQWDIMVAVHAEGRLDSSTLRLQLR